MREFVPPTASTRSLLPFPGAPYAQARALDRRQRLDQQQRSFQGRYRAIAADTEPASDRFPVIHEA